MAPNCNLAQYPVLFAHAPSLIGSVTRDIDLLVIDKDCSGELSEGDEAIIPSEATDIYSSQPLSPIQLQSQALAVVGTLDYRLFAGTPPLTAGRLSIEGAERTQVPTPKPLPTPNFTPQQHEEETWAKPLGKPTFQELLRYGISAHQGAGNYTSLLEKVEIRKRKYDQGNKGVLEEGTSEELVRLFSLSKEELMAVMGYTGTDYRYLNPALRGEISDAQGHLRDPRLRALKTPGELKEALSSYIDLLNSALRKMLPCPGTVYRIKFLAPSEVAHWLWKFTPGKTVVEKGFLSTSKDPEFEMPRYKSFEMLRYKSVEFRFVIEQKTGRNIAPISHSMIEEEVLMMPQTEFRVTGRRIYLNRLRQLVVEVSLREVTS